jgi:hypothetical protein
MDQSYYRADLNESAGEAVALPGVSLADGVAVWCSGPTAWEQTGPDAPVCAVAAIEPIGAKECNAVERHRWNVLETREKSAGDYGTPSELDSSGHEDGVVDVGDMAGELKTSRTGLENALGDAVGSAEAVTVVSPSPYGRATLVWPDDSSGLTNEATVSRSGRIMVRRTPIGR